MIVEIEILKESEKDEITSEIFSGDKLTSAVSQAIIYLQELQQKEMVV